jgi:NAD(P)H-dependent FMN reductase
MNLLIISGSTQKDSQSLKVSRFIHQRLQVFGFADRNDIFDLGENPISLWSETGQHKDANWSRLKYLVEHASGFVIVAPEWDGMAPAALKNIFHVIDREFSHKPALLIGVSAGPNGAYPIADLRAHSYKNSRICYIPEHIIVRNVHAYLNESPHGSRTEQESLLRERIDYALRGLYHYTKALQVVRESAPVDWERFPYGM